MAKKEKEEISTGKKVVKIVVKLLIFLVIVAGVAACIGGNYLVNYALKPTDASKNRDVEGKLEEKDVSYVANAETASGEAWANITPYEEVSITSDDNYKQKGRLYEGNVTNFKYVILVHGYKTDMSQMYSYAKHYYNEGYGVLLINLRTAGKKATTTEDAETSTQPAATLSPNHNNVKSTPAPTKAPDSDEVSEGKYIGMGWIEKEDLIHWIEMLTYKEPDAQIILHGVSMGASTCLMASGETLPRNVKAIVADCGYTSVYDIFKLEIANRFEQIPAEPALAVSSLLAKAKVGFTFKEASALEQVKKSKTPTLFIHGSSDNFVPVEMANKLYDACALDEKDKELFIVDGAGHCDSKDINPTDYFKKTDSFINHYIEEIKAKS